MALCSGHLSALLVAGSLLGQLACDHSTLHEVQDYALLPCGDGVIQEGEECDDGALNSDRLADACRTRCVVAHCGDGVVDTGEECDDGNNADNDGCSQECGAWYWTVQEPDRLGGGVTVDEEGNIYVAGSTTVSGTDHPWWAKYREDGGLVWEQIDLDSLWGYAHRIVVDPDGGQLFFSGWRGLVSLRGWVARADASDGHLTEPPFEPDGCGGAGSPFLIHDLAVDAEHVYVTGVASTGTACTSKLSRQELQTEWAKPYDLLPMETVGYSVDVSRTGDVYVGGGGIYGNWASTDMFVLRYDSSGELLQERRGHLRYGEDRGAAYAISVNDQSGLPLNPNGLIVAGQILFDFGPSGFVTTYNAWLSDVGWTELRSLELGDLAFISGVDVDAADNVYIVGELHDGATQKVLVEKLDPKGLSVWRREELVTADRGLVGFLWYDVAVDMSSNVYVLANLLAGPGGDPEQARGLWLRKYAVRD